MSHDYKIFNRIPQGWFRLAASTSLKKHKFKAIKAFDQTFYLYRDSDNSVHAYKPYCPHMGVSVKKFERVGNNLQCPFHAFQYNPDGECVDAYGADCEKLNLSMGYPLVEKNGQIFIFYTEDKRQPDWQIPDLEPGWMPYIYETSVFNSNPQEISENLVDYGHFEAIHGFKVITDPEIEITDECMIVRFDTIMPDKYLFHLNKHPAINRLEGRLYGMGYTIVNSELRTDDKVLFTSRTINFKTPIDAQTIEFTKGYSVEKATQIKPQLAALIRDHALWLVSAIGGYFAYREDMVMWDDKLYLDNPRLVKGDGPIMQFRKWAEQFYCSEQTVNIMDQRKKS